MKTDPAELLRTEYHRVARTLWDELNRHEVDHGCGGDKVTCDLDGALLEWWSDTKRMAEALDFVLLSVPPAIYRNSGYCTPGWMSDYLPGPWRP